MGSGGTLVGRDAERELVSSVLRGVQAGRPSALLVAGEPGIGKTSLVTEVTTLPEAEGHLVLWGRCLRFGADSSPYLPITAMLSQWHRQADEPERARVLAGAEHLATIAPSLGAASGPADAARVVPLVAVVLDRIAQRTPLVLVVDDAQWADGSSLDLLAYVLAGFTSGQRLGVLVTYRDTELGEGHRLHGWLADTTRLPAVSRLRLGRLGFSDAEALVARLRGTEASSRLAAEIFPRSGGNPYYTELLARRPADVHDPDSGGDLRQALLSSWHRLDPAARELLQLLAVGGRPVAVEVLERLWATRRGEPAQVVPALEDATTAGLTAQQRDGEIWFHHPLLAEVIASTLGPASRGEIHRQYVAILQAPDELAPASRAAHLALHHHGAGDIDAALVWSLRAADAAAEVRGYSEVSEHLHRACRLWEHATDDARVEAGDRIALLRRASDSAWSAGEYMLAVQLREEAVALAEAAGDASGVVRLRLTLLHRRVVCGLEPLFQVASVRLVLDRAAEACPGAPEHAQALALTAFAEYWSGGRVEAVLHCDAAVEMARRSGSVESLAWALSVRSQITGNRSDELADAEHAAELATQAGDPELMGVAALMLANCLERAGRRSDAVGGVLVTFRHLMRTSSVHDSMWAQPQFAALLLIELGRWKEARDVLRELLSLRQAPRHGSFVRAVAALLALRTGDLEAGHSHLARARENVSAGTDDADVLAYIEVEELWSLGEHREALSRVARLLAEDAVVDPVTADEGLVLASHVAADLAEQPGARPEAVDLLEQLEGIRASGPTPPFAPASSDDLLHPAYGLVLAAERARCHGADDAVERWKDAVSACHAADLVWEEALASYHLGRALLARRGSRRETAEALRRAARIATELWATPILRSVEELARQTHVPLGEPDPVDEDDQPLPGLTPREREVVAQVVAGRTYAEIAAALFISEKTVSVHVSNLLRKTGTTSRVELAELARRRT